MSEARSQPMLSVVIPVFNEASLVATASSALKDALDARSFDYEILFAENGSTDATPAILEELCRHDARLSWFHCETANYGAALKAGIERARGTFVVCDEIDLCDVSFYDRALPLLRSNETDFVIGSKAAPGSEDSRPLVRRLATRVHNGLLLVVLGFRGTDTHGVKAFRRDAVLPVVARCVVDMDVFASELVIRASRSGVRVLELPISLQEKRRPSIHLFRRVPNVLSNVVKLVVVLGRDSAERTVAASRDVGRNIADAAETNATFDASHRAKAQRTVDAAPRDASRDTADAADTPTTPDAAVRSNAEQPVDARALLERGDNTAPDSTGGSATSTRSSTKRAGHPVLRGAR